MKNLKLSFVVLFAVLAVHFAWGSVIAEEETLSAPAAVTVEDAEKQGSGSGRPPPRPRCPGDNCYQTAYCRRNCRAGDTGPRDCCDHGGLGNLCDDYCKALNGRRWDGQEVGCYCHCIIRRP